MLEDPEVGGGGTEAADPVPVSSFPTLLSGCCFGSLVDEGELIPAAFDIFPSTLPVKF